MGAEKALLSLPIHYTDTTERLLNKNWIIWLSEYYQFNIAVCILWIKDFFPLVKTYISNTFIVKVEPMLHKYASTLH